MMAYHTVGVIWFAMCCFYISNIFKGWHMISPASRTNRVARLFGNTIFFFLFVYLVGIAASISLIHGAGWSQWYIGVLAFYGGFADVFTIIKLKSMKHSFVRQGVTLVISVVSLVLLILARYEPAA
jgi:hypothetical protein